MDDLWPSNFEETAEIVSRPIQILKEQASLLGQKTDNFVLGRVEPIPYTYPDNWLIYKFVLVAPYLGHYVYELFSVRNQLPNEYPIFLDLDNEIEIPKTRIPTGIAMQNLSSAMSNKILGIEKINQTVEIKDTDDLNFFLKEIFKATETRKIIGYLIRLSKDMMQAESVTN